MLELVTLINILKILYLELACNNVCDTENFNQYCIVIQCSLMFSVIFAPQDVLISQFFVGYNILL